MNLQDSSRGREKNVPLLSLTAVFHLCYLLHASLRGQFASKGMVGTESKRTCEPKKERERERNNNVVRSIPELWLHAALRAAIVSLWGDGSSWESHLANGKCFIKGNSGHSGSGFCSKQNLMKLDRQINMPQKKQTFPTAVSVFWQKGATQMKCSLVCFRNQSSDRQFGEQKCLWGQNPSEIETKSRSELNVSTEIRWELPLGQKL